MRSAVVLVVVLSTFAHADAPRDALERARELERRLAYDEALAIVEAAIASGQANRAQLVELHLMAGRLSAGLDRAKAAEDHFVVVLALDPSRTLPDDVSPKISVPFTVARTKTAPLAVKLAVTKTEVTLDGGPLVTGIALAFGDGTTQIERATTRVARPPKAISAVRALDRHGNELWVGKPPPDEPGVPPPITPPILVDEPGMLTRWSTWTAVTGVVLVAGGIAAWRFDVAQNEFDDKREAGTTDFSELKAIETRGRRWSLAANISFGVAAATAITSVIFFVRHPREPAITITAGAGSVGVAGRF